MSSLNLLTRVWAASLLTLLAASWRLWLPDWNWLSAAGWTSDFPRVAMLSINPTLTSLLESLGLTTLLGALLATASRRRPRPVELGCVVVGLTALWVTNQHRLQPWAYQGWLYAAVFALASPPQAKRALTVLTISVYAYSSLGKFDQQFLRTVGPDFVRVLMPWLTPDAATGRFGIAESAVLTLPLAELSIALLLTIPRTRRWGGFAAIAMHLLLLLVLGPLGLGHSTAVLIWNLFLAVQAWLLFVRRPSESASPAPATDAIADRSPPPPLEPNPESATDPLATYRRYAVTLIVITAVVLPLGERLPAGRTDGYWDHWLSWALYSPHTSRVEIEIHGSQLDSLSAEAVRHSRIGRDDDGWHELRIDRWSLAELAVPVYPQARFQLGIAQKIAAQLESPAAIRVKIRGVANRRSGQRHETWLLGADEIDRAARHYWLLPKP